MSSLLALPRSRGLPPWLHDAGGTASGGHDDATIGLVTVPDPRPGHFAMPWFFNDRMSEWQAAHVLAPEANQGSQGLPQNTLEGAAALWYGSPSSVFVERIKRVPQNLPIVGADGKQALDFDVILIPGLEQPPLPRPTAGTGQTSPGIPMPSDLALPVGTPKNGASSEPAFWTPGKVAVAGAVGAGALAGIVYFATRPKRNPRRRRRR